MSGVRPRDRVLWLDVAKGVGILLVAWGHNPWFTRELSQWDDLLSTTRMPLFFFLAGVTLPVDRGWQRIAEQRADALLKPFLVIVVALGAVKLVNGSGSLASIALAAAYGTGFVLAWPPLWFLPHLWLLSVVGALVIPGIQRLAAPLVTALLVAIVVAGAAVVQAYHDPAGCALAHSLEQAMRCGLPFSADIVLLTGAFFLLGHLLRDRVRAFKPHPWVALCVLAIATLLWTRHGHSMVLAQRIYDDAFGSTAQALCGIYLALSLCALISRIAPLAAVIAYVGRGSLFVLAFHTVVQVKALAWLGPSAVDAVVAFTLSVVVSLLAWECAKRSRWLAWLLLPRRPIGATAAPTPAEVVNR